MIQAPSSLQGACPTVGFVGLGHKGASHGGQSGAAGESLLKEPMVLGREVVGVVARAAAGGKGPAAGTPVAVQLANPHAPALAGHITAIVVHERPRDCCAAGCRCAAEHPG